MAVGTSGCFSCELWIEIECVIGSSCSRLERRVDLSAVKFLRREDVRKLSPAIPMKLIAETETEM